MTGKLSLGVPLIDPSARIAPLRGPAGKGSVDSPEKIKKAAEQFEALLIGQMLKSSREEGSDGWLGTGQDQGGQTGMQLAEEHFASLIASRGGLGLSKFITANLVRKSQ
jgi:Rod binding domain-containing protein